MSKAKIIFYRNIDEKNFENLTFEKVVTSTGLSKSQFTTLLYDRALEVCRKSPFNSFVIVDRIDTITELKNEKNSRH